MTQHVTEICDLVADVAAGRELLCRAGVYAVTETLAGGGYESNR